MATSNRWPTEAPIAGFYRLLHLQPHIRETVPEERYRPPLQERIPKMPFHKEGIPGKPAAIYDVFRSGGLTTVNGGTSLSYPASNPVSFRV